jgi:hypothetical protein
MPYPVLDHLARGSFAFLNPDPLEIQQVLPAAEAILPSPQPVYLEDEAATPVIGFPILASRSIDRLNELLNDYLAFEEAVQIAYLNRSSFDSKAYASSWEAYRSLLAQLLENATASSHALDFAALFWLQHSLPVSRNLAELPKRVRRKDLAMGKDHGDAIKYRVFQKWLERVLALSEDIAKRLAPEMGENEKNLVPRLLGVMRHNVLIFTEDYISPDLSELGSYFHGLLKVDGREFRLRLRSLEEWHLSRFQNDAGLRSVVADLLALDPDIAGSRLLYRSGYLRFLSRQPGYSTSAFLSPDQIDLWEKLLIALKEYEIIHALRKMIVPIEVEDGQLISRDRSINSTWVGGPAILRLSPATRPIDFGAPWVINPVVHRFGLIYDISDFSATLSLLGRAQKNALEDAFRMTAQFQRQINNLAAALQVRLEKYLGDGAFYSGRHPRRILLMAIQLQRLYPQFVERGYPFNRGLRIALNYGEYRLLPLLEEKSQIRYEFFGHGLVELSRLTTGKKGQELDELRTYLISQGYPEVSVNKFFAPLMRRDTDLVSKTDESRPFYAYINQNHTLINEGLVATEPFIARLGSFTKLFYGRDHGRGFIVVPLEVEGISTMIGLRKLGIGKFKGLEPMPVYEVVDAVDWDPKELKEIPPQRLLSSLERLFTKTVAAAVDRQRQPAASSGET